MTLRAPFFLAVILAVVLAGCSGGSSPEGAPVFEASLKPASPTEDITMRFSPKAEAVELQAVDGGMEGAFVLGSSGSEPIRARLEKSGATDYFDVLKMDTDRDGTFGDDESMTTEPSEIRYKMWSSFEADLESMVMDSTTSTLQPVPYPVSLWYVEDLREEQTDHALRFTRRGWTEGRVTLDGVDAWIRFSDSNLDGVITMDDDWALAGPDSMANIYDIDLDRPGKRHAWVGERAYQLLSVDPTGQSARLEYIDPGVTRAKEREDDDQLAVDRRAPHSGSSVAFMDDFAVAERTARKRGVPLFVDFETTWCGPCKTMDEWVYSADPVVAASEGVIAVKVDGDDFPDIAERFEVVAYPTMVLVDGTGAVSNRLVGYQGVEVMTDFFSN